MKTQMLRGKIVEAGTTIEALAAAIGMNRSTFHRKLKAKGNTFTVEEMNNMVKVLNLNKEDAIAIFFD